MCWTQTFANRRLQQCRNHHSDLKGLQRKLQAALIMHDRQCTFSGGSEQRTDVQRLHYRLQNVTNTLCALEAVLDTVDTANFLSKVKISLKSLVTRSRHMIDETKKEIPQLLEGLQDTREDMDEITAQMSEVVSSAADASPCESLLPTRDPETDKFARSGSPQSPMVAIRHRRRSAQAEAQ